MCFKFQSDSINTIQVFQDEEEVFNFKFQSDSINTRTSAAAHTHLNTFKFQSDSINTSDHSLGLAVFSDL